MVAALFALFGGDDGGSHTTATRTARSGAVAAASLPTMLLAQPGDNGNAASVMVVAPAHDRKGGEILLMPPGTMTPVPSFDLEELGKTSGLGGVPLLQATVENLLGISVDGARVLHGDDLQRLVGPAGDLTVDLPERVEQVAANGDVTVLWDPGKTVVSPADVESLLKVKGDGSDLARMARQASFFRAWLARLRAHPERLPAAGTDEGLRPVLAALAAGPVHVRVLPVDPLDAGGDDELYQVDQSQLDALVAQAFPTSGRSGQDRPRVQILNGTGVPGLAQSVTVRLVQSPSRPRILYTGNASGFDHATTEVVFYDKRRRDDADQVRKALGVGRLVFSRNDVTIVDVTVVVGKDFR